jgi:hypothetical protein
MQIIDSSGNVYGGGNLEINSADGKVKTSGGAGAGVTSVSATTPISSSGGTTPNISIALANATTSGYLSSTDWNTFNNKYDASNPAGYITTVALSGYLTSATAAATYYPLTNPSGYTSNTGTVTSVQLAAGTGISLSGTNPITTSGTITVATSGVTINKMTVTDGTAVTGTTSSTLTGSILIPANTVAVGDLIYVKMRIRKTGTGGTVTTRMYVNTSAAIGGSLIATSATAVATTLYFQYSRTLAVKSTINTESMAGNLNVNADDNTSVTVAVSASNIDWTVDQYLIVAVANSSLTDVTRSSFIHAQINKA